MGQNSWRKPHVLEDWRFMGYPHNGTCICILTVIFITSKKAGSQVHICWAVTAPAVCFKGCALSIPRQKFSWVPCYSFPLSHGGDHGVWIHPPSSDITSTQLSVEFSLSWPPQKTEPETYRVCAHLLLWVRSLGSQGIGGGEAGTVEVCLLIPGCAWQVQRGLKKFLCLFIIDFGEG